MALTLAQKKAYLADPSMCPFCGSDQVRMGCLFWRGYGKVDMDTGCNDCGNKWRDIYTLTDVEEVGHPPELKPEDAYPTGEECDRLLEED